MVGECGEEWIPVLSLATLKVVAVVRQGRRRYMLSVESRLPVSQRNEYPPTLAVPSPYSDESKAEDGKQRGGLNAPGPLNFPIEVALDACLVTTSLLPLPADARFLRELGIDALVLAFGGVPGAAGAGAAFGASEACAEFPDAVVLHALPPGEVGQWPIRGSRRLSGANATALPRSCSTSETRYAFVFDGPRGSAELRAGDSEVALSPLDALYLARLCALDNGQHQQFLAQDGVGVDGAAACPPHILSSDEVLTALLSEGVACGCVPAAQPAALLRLPPPLERQEDSACPPTSGTCVPAVGSACDAATVRAIAAGDVAGAVTTDGGGPRR